MPEDDQIEWARELYGGLIDAGLTAHDATIEVEPERDRASEVARRLDVLFRERPEPRGVAIRLAGFPEGPLVGISSHARVRQSLGLAGAPGGADWGAADRATLLGSSTQYRALLFVCRACGQGMAYSYYDERSLPVCLGAPAHGVMELVR